MKCEYWWLDHWSVNDLGKPHPTKHCENEGAAYFTCDFIDAIVCEKCRCRCYKSCPPMTDQEIKEHIEAREERHKRWEEKQKK